MADYPFVALERQERLSDRVQAQLQELILSQELRAGSRLPPERELADRLGVSRTVVREAVRSLVAKGLLEVRTGSGTYVRELPREVVSESVRLFARTHVKDARRVYEVRRALEVEIAGLAAERRSPEDVEHLEGSIRRLARPGLTPEAFAEEDAGFHARLAEATQNELFSVLLGSLAGVMGEAPGGFIPAEVQARAVHFHRLICERVKAGDAEGARRAMAAHIEESMGTMAREVRQ